MRHLESKDKTMNEPSDRLINLFGALVQGVGDRIQAATMVGMTLGGEAAAAIIVIGHGASLSINQLARVLRLSHPGTVRLIDRLANAGFAQRNVASHDRRVVVLTLTDYGRTERQALLDRRHKALAAILRATTPSDQVVLERVAETLLVTLPVDATAALTICRFCNEQKCADCPMDVFGPGPTALVL
jgi:MarR family transcriptional repressor of emrRAB